uniref:RRM domain-containing protein n=1 Tax=Lactuca sativa TaxID=4236 RepID=A0A9R1WB34_LACSA|nr:hypothetical protein LSAT_V11C200057600 [Lactuca sativa]
MSIGRVVDLHIPRDNETDKPKGFAFAEYETEEIVDYAVKLFTGLVTLYNKTLRFWITGQDKATLNMQAPSMSMLTYTSTFKSSLHEDVTMSPLSRYAQGKVSLSLGFLLQLEFIIPVAVRADYIPSRVDLPALGQEKYVELVNLFQWKVTFFIYLLVCCEFICIFFH